MMRLPMPDAALADWKQKIRRTEKAAFFTAVVVGLMVHLFAFTNKLYNYDELCNTPGGWGIGSENNRWFLEFMGRSYASVMGGSYSLPLFNGMISIFFLAVSAVLVVKMFDVGSVLLSAAIGGFLVSFSSVVCMFFFMFLSIYYAAGIFFSVLGAYLIVRYPGKLTAYPAAVILLTLSLGTYQAYFPAAVCLLLIAFLMHCAFGKEKADFKGIVITALRYLATAGAALALYLILSRVIWNMWNVFGVMGSYQGIDTMGHISLQELGDGILRCYRSFVSLCFDNVRDITPVVPAIHCFRIIFLLLAASVVLFLVASKIKWYRRLLFAAGLLVFPVALFLVYIMAPKASYYALMFYPAVFLLVFLAVWTDRFGREIRGYDLVRAGTQWGALFCSVLLLFIYIWYGNGSYMALEYTKYHDFSYFQTLVTQIKSLEGYDDEMRVVFVGGEVDDETNAMGSMMHEVFAMGGRAETNVTVLCRAYLIVKYLGFAPEIAGYEETIAWMDREDVRNMESYPHGGSIRVIDDTIIVKFSDSGEPAPESVQP